MLTRSDLRRLRRTPSRGSRQDVTVRLASSVVRRRWSRADAGPRRRSCGVQGRWQAVWRLGKGVDVRTWTSELLKSRWGLTGVRLLERLRTYPTRFVERVASDQGWFAVKVDEAPGAIEEGSL